LVGKISEILPRLTPGSGGSRTPVAEDVSLPQRLAFVIQLSAPEAGSGRFVGRISHVVSARGVRFVSPEECLAFITRVVREETGEGEGSR
jgi:hypothetical protein